MEEKEMLTEEITLRLVKEIKRFLLEDALALSRSSDEQLMVRIKEIIDHKLVHYEITPQEREKIARRVFSSLRGLGILDELLNDDSITEIMINGPENIFVEKDGQIYRYRRQFESEQHLLDIIQRIVGEAGKEVNQANPIVDTRIQKDGSRVNVVLPPISLAGPVVTIRKFSKKPMTVEKLLEYGSITPEVADFLQKLVRAKYNIFISGGTGSGKTTLMNTLLEYIPYSKSGLIIQENEELFTYKHPDLMFQHTVIPRTYNEPPIGLADLARNGLLTDLDYFIIGEIKGAEALPFLNAAYTGHQCWASVHGASSTQALNKLADYVKYASDYSREDALKMLMSMDVIIYMKDYKIYEISEISGWDYEKKEIKYKTIYKKEIVLPKKNKETR